MISSLSGGGAEKSIAQLANIFSKKEDVSLLTLCGSDNPINYRLSPNVKLIHAGVASSIQNKIFSLTSLKRILHLRKIIKNEKPEIVISFVEKTNIFILISLIFSQIQVIVCERTVPLVHDIGFFWNFLRRVFYPFARFVVFQTKFSRKQLRWVKDENSKVIPNFLLPLKKSKTSRKKRIITVGRLSKEKDQKIIVQAFAFLNQKYPDWELLFIGDGPEREFIEKEISKYSLEKSVKILGWKKDPHKIITESEIFVLTSKFEGFPNALMEAMALGCACISTDCPAGPREIIQDGENGILIPVGDINSLSLNIERLIKEPKFRRRLGKNAQKVGTIFSIDKILQDWENLFYAVNKPIKF